MQLFLPLQYIRDAERIETLPPCTRVPSRPKDLVASPLARNASGDIKCPSRPRGAPSKCFPEYNEVRVWHKT